MIAEIELNDSEKTVLQLLYNAESIGKHYLVREDFKIIDNLDDALIVLLRLKFIDKHYFHPRYRFMLNKKNDFINKNYPTKVHSLSIAKSLDMNITRDETSIKLTLDSGFHINLKDKAALSLLVPENHKLIKKITALAEEIQLAFEEMT